MVTYLDCGGPSPTLSLPAAREGMPSWPSVTNIARCIARSLRDPEGFWAEQAEGDRLDEALGQGARCVATRRSIAGSPAASSTPATTRSTATSSGGRAEQTALIYDSPVTSSKKSFTYRELRDQRGEAGRRDRRAGRRQGRPGHHLHADDPRGGDGDAGLRAAGRGAFGGVRRLCRQRARHPHRRLHAQAGADGVVRHRAGPHRPVQAVARPGDRARRAQDRALAIVFQRPQADGDDGARAATSTGTRRWRRPRRTTACRSKATDPLYILYTSGTTGQPKGVVRDNGGYCVALAWSMKNLYGIEPGEVWWCASDVGWVVGHSYIVYGPLIHGATSILYEGKPVGTPDAGAFWRVISEHKAVALFTAPTAFRAIKKEDPDGKLLKQYDLSKLPHPVPGRRARRSADHRMGAEAPGRADRRSLVADRDRLGDLRQLRRPRSDADQARLVLGAVAGLGSRSAGRAGQADEARARSARSPPGCRCRRATSRPCGTPTSASGRPISTEYPGYYKTGDAGFIDAGRLRLGDDAGRRRDQRRRPPPVDRPDRGSAGARTTTSPNAP